MKFKKEFNNYLIENNFIELFNTKESEYYRFYTESDWLIGSNIITKLKEEYIVGCEIGGIIFFKPSKQNDRVLFSAEECILISNDAEEPSWQYRPNPKELVQARKYAASNNLIPIDFHTHPILSENIVFESMKFYSQMETSGADKKYGYFDGMLINDKKLRLPEFLVIGNGTINKGVFMGIYGGLIAPLDFNNRKNELVVDMFEKTKKGIVDFFDTPEKKYWGTLGGIAASIGLIFLFVKYPKSIFPTFISAGSIIPMIAYSRPESNVQFGISHGQDLNITVSRALNESILKDEESILKLIEESSKEK